MVIFLSAMCRKGYGVVERLAPAKDQRRGAGSIPVGRTVSGALVERGKNTPHYFNGV